MTTVSTHNVLRNFFLCYITMFAKQGNLDMYFDYFFTITYIIFIWVCFLPTACSIFNVRLFSLNHLFNLTIASPNTFQTDVIREFYYHQQRA